MLNELFQMQELSISICIWIFLWAVTNCGMNLNTKFSMLFINIYRIQADFCESNIFYTIHTRIIIMIFLLCIFL